jgi:hypothetical protein
VLGHTAVHVHIAVAQHLGRRGWIVSLANVPPAWGLDKCPGLTTSDESITWWVSIMATSTTHL